MTRLIATAVSLVCERGDKNDAENNKSKEKETIKKTIIGNEEIISR